MWSDHPFSQRKNDKRKSSGGANWKKEGGGNIMKVFIK